MRERRMMLGLALAAGLLSWPPPVHKARAQVVSVRPTPIEVAAAMVPCIAERAAFQVTASGDVAKAEIIEAGIVTMQLERDAGEPLRRMAGYQVWLDDDPVQPPMVLSFTLARARYAEPIRDASAACFEDSYRHLLRP